VVEVRHSEGPPFRAAAILIAVIQGRCGESRYCLLLFS